MKQGLQLKFGQNLTMTPQLQQAIRLLQLSSLELQQEIQEALENNPLLELPEEEHTPNWEQNLSAGISTSSGIAAEDDYIYQGETNESLQDYLLWQMRLSHFSETDEQIALIIIDAIDDSGYLTQSLDEVLEAAQQQDDEITGAEVTMVLKRIQNFEPIGVASRTVRECLLLQLEQLPKDTPALAATKNVVDNYLDLLGKHDYRTLARKSRLKEAVIRDVLALLQNLNPRPGDSFSSGDSNYVIPDIQVRKHQGRWIAELHPASAPRLRVNQTYAAMGSSKSNENCSSGDAEYIKQHLQEARWFIKSIESRNETLLKVAHCIVQRQQAFFEYGPESMKPMILSDVADSIDMHESTISRVTTQKFMHSPQGVFELKYFFSSHVSTDEGGEYSSTAIRALIRKLIAAENPGKPLSDNKLAQLLADQGIQVARRTIAKYRESLNIPPSSQRKSLL
ncbi:RNA polymerase factor sigma-54 [Aliidiomarina iranensis]|uniref:RNA polymerase sigma-54 factor n=1 Tax=Aliidiomarina iranensis TaxID=1434071 RepID=A0A432W2Y4_9GAMM|nr:RNA polymerase factor sigma-54 [Aliidiomarina iranensis]RUO23486.1 RNA polymerase factor sigma-54 [Aliidiomarina iranensis]